MTVLLTLTGVSGLSNRTESILRCLALSMTLTREALAKCLLMVEAVLMTRRMAVALGFIEII